MSALHTCAEIRNTAEKCQKQTFRIYRTLVVDAMRLQTLRVNAAPEDAKEAIQMRLPALSQAHDVLTRESWEGADLIEVVTKALEPYETVNENRLHVSGPHVRLTPRMSLALAIALHELATNAVKYGALSNKIGIVEVSWTV